MEEDRTTRNRPDITATHYCQQIILDVIRWCADASRL